MRDEKAAFEQAREVLKELENTLRENEITNCARAVTAYELAHTDLSEGRPSDAVEILLAAIEPNDPAGQYNWGSDYFNGLKVPMDYKKACWWFTKAHEQGYADATTALGYMYQEGLFVSKDYEKAYALYLEAANKGNAQAQRSLGVLLINGDGVERNPLLALEWMTKAAEAADLQAMRFLGQMLIEEDDIPKDVEKGYEWLRRAAEKGDEESVQILKDREITKI